jgi:signal transduction histidine kinase/ActR/RegA family two-component response regulator
MPVRLTIRYKIFFAVMTVIVGLIIGFSSVTLQLLADIGRREVLLSVENAVLSYLRYDEQRRELMLVQARSLAAEPRLTAVLSVPGVDTDAVVNAIPEVAYSESITGLVVFDARGALLAEVGARILQQGAGFTAERGLRQALGGTPYYGNALIGDQYYQLAIAPSYAGGKLVGLVMVVQRLNTDSALDILRDVTGMKLAMLMDDFPGAGDFRQDAEKNLLLPLRADTVRRIGEPHGRVRDLDVLEIEGAGKTYFAVRIPRGERGELMMYRDAQLLPSTISRVRWLVILCIFAAVIIGAAVSLWISSRISKPVLALTEAARKYGDGDFAARVPSGSTDELGQLTDSFNKMADEIVHSQAELVASKEAAEAASRAKSTFLAVMSHEIRTPLNGVLGMAELLSHSTLGVRQNRYLDVIRESGKNLMGVISNILDFSKIEAGKLDLNNTRFDLRELVEELCSVHAVDAEEKGLEFACDIAPDIAVEVEADATRLRQVLTNLIGNAIKFTQQGHVAIVVRLLEQQRGCGRFVFEISDTGIGIAQDRIEHVFESFNQADESTTRIYGGSGLGLAISKQLAVLMGGQIGVESESGVGTRFAVELCFSTETPADVLGSEQIAGFAGARVLVVDGLDIRGQSLCRQIENWSLPCTSVTNAADCLAYLPAALAESNPCLVLLLDCGLPENSAFTLLEQIISDARFESVRVVGMCSGVKAEVAEKAIQLGADSYLLKPIRQAELFAALCDILLDEHTPGAWQKTRRGIPARGSEFSRLLGITGR